MVYALKLYADEGTAEADPLAQAAAEQRFSAALNAALGDAQWVLLVYTAYKKLLAIYGESPAPEVLSAEEQEIFTQWQAAESAALTAALGPHRYMGEAQFEITACPTITTAAKTAL